jgi:hypothetical protein
LDGTNASLLKVNNLVTESKSELLGLQLPGNISARERPIENGDRASKHALHGLGGQALSVATPFDSHWVRTAHVGDDDGRTNIAMGDI